jgi:serine/threonine protein kinase
LLHCDIRPRNILIDEYGILKISDFKLMRKIPKTPLGSQRLEMRGCPLYMCPELFSSEGVHSYSSDLWAVGCFIFELRMGGTPYSSQWWSDSPDSPHEDTVDEILRHMNQCDVSAVIGQMNKQNTLLRARQGLQTGNQHNNNNNSDQRNKQQQKDRSKSPGRVGSHSTQNGEGEGGMRAGPSGYVPSLSPALQDLLGWMLERAPPYRCTWYCSAF